MRTNKNTHSFRPIVENSYRKSDRKYPEPKPLEQYNFNATIPLISNTIEQEETEPTIQRKHGTQIILGKKSNQKRFSFLVGQPTFIRQKESTYLDDTCLWSYALQNPIFNQQVRSITFIAAQLVFRDYVGDTYPNMFYISVDGVMGFYDQQNKMTDRVAILELQQIQPIWDETKIKSYDLRYSLKREYTWQIPIGITVINMRLKDENGNEKRLPLINDMPIQFLITNK